MARRPSPRSAKNNWSPHTSKVFAVGWSHTTFGSGTGSHLIAAASGEPGSGPRSGRAVLVFGVLDFALDAVSRLAGAPRPAACPRSVGVVASPVGGSPATSITF